MSHQPFHQNNGFNFNLSNTNNNLPHSQNNNNNHQQQQQQLPNVEMQMNWMQQQQQLSQQAFLAAMLRDTKTPSLAQQQQFGPMAPGGAPPFTNNSLHQNLYGSMPNGNAQIPFNNSAPGNFPYQFTPSQQTNQNPPPHSNAHSTASLTSRQIQILQYLQQNPSQQNNSSLLHFLHSTVNTSPNQNQFAATVAQQQAQQGMHAAMLSQNDKDMRHLLEFKVQQNPSQSSSAVTPTMEENYPKAVNSSSSGRQRNSTQQQTSVSTTPSKSSQPMSQKSPHVSVARKNAHKHRRQASGSTPARKKKKSAAVKKKATPKQVGLKRSMDVRNQQESQYILSQRDSASKASKSRKHAPKDGPFQGEKDSNIVLSVDENEQEMIRNLLERPKKDDILPVKWTHNVQVDDTPWGKVIDIRQENGQQKYYIHYIDYDRRLDEWVDESCLDLVYYTERGSKRRLKRKKKDDHDDHHEDPRTSVKNVERIQIGPHEIDSWYFSPYPSEYTNVESNPEKKLFLCEFCLQYSKTEQTLKRHMKKCKLRHPPGNEIYRDGDLSVFELDGCCQRIYCENLCLLAKLYLDHKTLQYDVEPFLFYVMTVRNERGYHIVGYFSKEKFSSEDYNLACILTLPQYQKMGFGFLLIQFSYVLSRKEEKDGTPERPLSDLGRVSYESYWRFELVEILQQYALAQGEISVKEIQELTRMKEKDILHTLQKFGIIKYHHGQYILCLSEELLKKHEGKKKKMTKFIKPELLRWVPDNSKKVKFKASASYI